MGTCVRETYGLSLPDNLPGIGCFDEHPSGGCYFVSMVLKSSEKCRTSKPSSFPTSALGIFGSSKPSLSKSSLTNSSWMTQ